MSVSEVEYSAMTESFEVRVYLFQDDLKEAVYGDPLSPLLENAAISEYILAHIELEIDNEPVPLSFIELKERKDQVQVIFTTKKVNLKGANNVLISNELLIETFPKQTNMVYLSLPDKSRLTQILNAVKTIGEFEI